MRAIHLALAAVAAAATPAHADVDHGRTPVLIADGACDALILASFAPISDNASGYVFFTGLFAQAVAAPLVHGSQGDWERAGIDVGNRVALPLLGVWLVDQFCGDSLNCLGPSLAGGVAGAAIAQVIDWLVISQPTPDATATPRIISIGGHF